MSDGRGGGAWRATLLSAQSQGAVQTTPEKVELELVCAEALIKRPLMKSMIALSVHSTAWDLLANE